MTNSEFDEAAKRDAARQPGMRIVKSRAASSRLPAGTIPLTYHQPVFATQEVVAHDGCMPIVDARKPRHEELRAAALLMDRVFAPVLNADDSVDGAEIVQAEALAMLDRCVRSAFGCDAATASWLVPFMAELERARCARYTHDKDTDKNGGERDTIIVELARGVLERTNAASAVPPWLSLKLTALLVRRFTFGRGAGPAGEKSAKMIHELLTNPRALRSYLQKHKGIAARFQAELAALELAISPS